MVPPLTSVSGASGPEEKSCVSVERTGSAPGSPTASLGEMGGGPPAEGISSASRKVGSRRGDTSPRLVDLTGGDLLPEKYKGVKIFTWVSSWAIVPFAL